MRVKWLRTALRNLEDEIDYIAGDDPAAATRILDRILEAVEHLREHPSAGRRGRVPGTRELVVAGTPFLIPYRIRSDAVEILRVFHGARKWPADL